MDHYIGCAYANDKIFNVKWIAPRFEIEKSFNSLRLGVYLAKLNNLVLLNKKYKYNPNDKVKLNIGSCNDGKVSEKNRRGIYLYITETVSGKDINLLLTGDVPYNCYYNKLYDLSFLVAPHHGADMNFNKTDYQLNKFYVNEYKEKTAIISCNNNKNSKNRPIKKHVDYLNNDMHFVVLTTESGNDKYKSNNKNGYFHYDLLNPKKTKFI